MHWMIWRYLSWLFALYISVQSIWYGTKRWRWWRQHFKLHLMYISFVWVSCIKTNTHTMKCRKRLIYHAQCKQPFICTGKLVAFITKIADKAAHSNYLVLSTKRDKNMICRKHTYSWMLLIWCVLYLNSMTDIFTSPIDTTTIISCLHLWRKKNVPENGTKTLHKNYSNHYYSCWFAIAASEKNYPKQTSKEKFSVFFSMHRLRRIQLKNSITIVRE